MFVCRACLRSLTGTAASPVGPRLFSSLRTTPSTISRGRPFAGQGIKVDLESALPAPLLKGRKAPDHGKSIVDEEEELDFENIKSKGSKFEKEKYEKKLEAAVRKRLDLFPDPYHIAQHVTAALEKSNFDEALLMTRLASRKAKVEVSWNHLIDYQLKNKRLHAAIKLYNEMKKRAQTPNAKTYTIIFRGCASSLHPKLAVAEATRLYNFMMKHPAVKPNTIHMNAALAVCARAGDMESLFTVLATSNDSTRAPDATTYTIVLNALRYDARAAGKANFGLADADVKREVQKSIQQASRIWADVVAAWKGAKMPMDEYLVCAMGRVLTAGDYKDNESVLELLEQTMQIPRFDKPKVKLPAMPDPGPTDMSPKAQQTPAKSTAKTDLRYPQPGTKTLSLVLTALTNTRKTASAAKYWSYLTRDLGVTPDHENYFCYLGALASGHASAQVAALIEEMPQNILGPITFRRGFSVCVGDNLNPTAFENACRILDVMTATQRYPDALALRLYLQAARANTRHFYEQPDAPDAGNPEHGRQIMAAIERMWEPFRILSGSLSYPPTATRSPQEELDKKRGDMQEVMATGRRMIAAIDRAVTDQLVTEPKSVKLLRTRRAVLQRQVERWIAKIYPEGAPADVFKVGKDALEDDEQLSREDPLRDWLRRAGQAAAGAGRRPAETA